MTSSGEPVLNVDLLRRLLLLIRRRPGKVRFVHVKAHVGTPGNEKADALAKEGAEMREVGRAAEAADVERWNREARERTRSPVESEDDDFGQVRLLPSWFWSHR